MDIRTATLQSLKNGAWLRKRDRTEAWCMYVAAGSVYRNEDGEQIDLDARDCMGDDWYLVNDSGEEVGA